MEVYKFGGASLKDATGFARMRGIVEHFQGPLLVVVSALGKTTNALEEVVDAYLDNEEDPVALLQGIKERHFTLIDQLKLQDPALSALLNELFVEIEWMLEEDPDQSSEYIYDQIVGIGEMLSSAIFEAYLRSGGQASVWIDVRDVLKTSDHHRAAQVHWEKTREGVEKYILPQINNHKVVVTQGFVGATDDNYTTTLGREGSDFSGAVFASICHARRLTVWKDVPGIMTADPAIDSTAQLIPELDYSVAGKMARLGAKVVHPKTMQPMAEQGLPITVRSFLTPDESGSTISSFTGISYPTIVVHKAPLTRIEVSGTSAELVDKIVESYPLTPFYIAKNGEQITVICDETDQSLHAFEGLPGILSTDHIKAISVLFGNATVRKQILDQGPVLQIVEDDVEQYFFKI